LEHDDAVEEADVILTLSPLMAAVMISILFSTSSKDMTSTFG